MVFGDSSSKLRRPFTVGVNVRRIAPIGRFREIGDAPAIYDRPTNGPPNAKDFIMNSRQDFRCAIESELEKIITVDLDITIPFYNPTGNAG